jgi:hypothetical protein
MLQQFAKFQAIGEGGTKFVISVYYDHKDYRTKDGIKTLKNGPYLETSDGYKVEKVEKGQYYIKELNSFVMSDDPNAI